METPLKVILYHGNFVIFTISFTILHTSRDVLCLKHGTMNKASKTYTAGLLDVTAFVNFSTTTLKHSIAKASVNKNAPHLQAAVDAILHFNKYNGFANHE